MNDIRKALHTAARKFAIDAHRSFCAAESAYDAAFRFAVTGKQLERVLQKIQYNNHRAAYHIRLTKAKRCRGMMADANANNLKDPRTAETQKMACVA